MAIEREREREKGERDKESVRERKSEKMRKREGETESRRISQMFYSMIKTSSQTVTPRYLRYFSKEPWHEKKMIQDINKVTQIYIDS